MIDNNCHRNVPGLARGQRHNLILLRLPADGAAIEEEENTCRALAVVDVAGHAAIIVTDKPWLFQLLRVMTVTAPRTNNVPKYMFDCRAPPGVAPRPRAMLALPCAALPA